MQKRHPGYVKVSQRQVREEEVSSKDLTKRELFSYVLSDFFRISYDVLAIFFDGLILPEIYFLRPRGPLYSSFERSFSLSGITYMIYMYCVIALLEASAVWLQIHGYRRLWPKVRSSSPRSRRIE